MVIVKIIYSAFLWCIYQLLQASNAIGLLITAPFLILVRFIRSFYFFCYTSLQRMMLWLQKNTTNTIKKVVKKYRKTRKLFLTALFSTQKWLQNHRKKIQTRFKKLFAKKKPHVSKIKKSANNKAVHRSFPFAYLVVLPLAIWAGCGAANTITSYVVALPNPSTLANFKTPAATLIYDRTGVLLYSAYDSLYRVPVSLSDVPQLLVDATIQSEDARFRSHHGVDPQGVMRAIINNTQHKPTQGGSTITQQLARVSFLTQEHTIKRKLDEAIIAIKIERNFTKDQILELYFNTVPYGGVTVGVEAAAKHYFQKSVQDLTPTEAVFLASLTPAPSAYAQLAQENPANYGRIRLLADDLLANNTISQELYDELTTAVLVFAPQVNYKRAPHAVDFVLAQVLEKAQHDPQFAAGTNIYTTIDLELQNKLQQAVLSEVTKSGKKYNFSNASLLVADPKTGEVRAMIGSANYYETSSGQVNATTAPRQLGSTLKIVPYALALESGMTPSTTIIDEPVRFPGYQNYQPRNYDGAFHGTVTLTEALGNSYNIPALKLANTLGIDRVAEQGVRMGITEFATVEQSTPLALAIGGVETTLFNLTQAYQVVADHGEKQPLHIISRISDYQGTILYQESHMSERILTEKTAQQLSEMLSSPVARQAMFGRPAYFDFGSNAVAIKTGTSNNLKDNVAVAFTDSFVVATWTGNNSGEPMSNIASGQTGATPIMHQATSIVLQELTATNLVSK
jgi:penicillin-binding protein 1C